MMSPGNTAAVVGLGQLGGVFAHGLLRTGHTVVPVRREDDLATTLSGADPSLVLICVGEDELGTVLTAVPEPLRGRCVLVQNELLPDVWAPFEMTPTVAVVWFEKKANTPVVPILSTPIAGPMTARVVDALRALDIPAHQVSQDILLQEMVLKNLYIITANAAGLVLGGTTGALAEQHRARATAIALEVFAIQLARVTETLGEESAKTLSSSRDGLIDRLFDAFMADPQHGTKGRSAPVRLARALTHASTYGIAAPELLACRAS